MPIYLGCVIARAVTGFVAGLLTGFLIAYRHWRNTIDVAAAAFARADDL